MFPNFVASFASLGLHPSSAKQTKQALLSFASTACLGQLFCSKLSFCCLIKFIKTMPQLDQVTYFSQFFWLCVSFFTFYFLISKNFLPKMARILKVRKRKITASQTVKNQDQEKEKVNSTSKTVIENGLNLSANLLVKRNFLKNSEIGGNQNLQSSQVKYIKWISETNLRQQIGLQAAGPVTSYMPIFSLLEIMTSKLAILKKK